MFKPTCLSIGRQQPNAHYRPLAVAEGGHRENNIPHPKQI